MVGTRFTNRLKHTDGKITETSLLAQASEQPTNSKLHRVSVSPLKA